ncbi:MAG: hypothetical protein WB630_02430 [Candidatus Acidiferrales bacterium]
MSFGNDSKYAREQYAEFWQWAAESTTLVHPGQELRNCTAKILASRFAWAHICHLEALVSLEDFLAKLLGRDGNRSKGHGYKHAIGSLNDQRRAQRLPICMPVMVYGRLGSEPFVEPTETINVSARGGLVLISSPVACRQEVVLTNMQTEEDLLCRVVRLIRSEKGYILAGLEFLEAAPGFWRSSPATND